MFSLTWIWARRPYFVQEKYSWKHEIVCVLLCGQLWTLCLRVGKMVEFYMWFLCDNPWVETQVNVQNTSPRGRANQGEGIVKMLIILVEPHNISQSHGCAPWDHVSSKQNHPLILRIPIHEDHSNCVIVEFSTSNYNFIRAF